MKDDPTNTVAALGLRVHSGWAALVALAEPVAEPKVIGRNRIELVESGKRDYLQPYHAAAELEFGEADAFIKRRFTVSQSIAIQALGAPIERLRREGYRLARCGLLLSSGLPPADLRATLQSHALIHAAEGHFFREALLEACWHRQLSVSTVTGARSLRPGRPATRYLAGRITMQGRGSGPFARTPMDPGPEVRGAGRVVSSGRADYFTGLSLLR